MKDRGCVPINALLMQLISSQQNLENQTMSKQHIEFFCKVHSSMYFSQVLKEVFPLLSISSFNVLFCQVVQSLCALLRCFCVYNLSNRLTICSQTLLSEGIPI